jgi:hypothetical protein
MVSAIDIVTQPGDLADLEHAFDFVGADVVRRFIQSNPSLVPLLREAHDEIATSFGVDTRTALVVVRDPEEEGSGTLYAFIQTADDPEIALNRLESFNDTWWRTAVGLDAVPLHFALEYVGFSTIRLAGFPRPGSRTRRA